MSYKRIAVAVVFGLSMAGAARSAHAVIISEGSGATLRYGYGATAGGIDSNTAHLWQLDEDGAINAGNPAVDTGNSADLINFTDEDSPAAVEASVLQAGGGATNNARRIGTTGNGTGGLHIGTSGTSNVKLSANQANSTFGSDGARTIDILIRTDLISGTANQRILTGENEGGTNNFFLGLILDSGPIAMQYSHGGAAVGFELPTSGDDAIAAGSWYHLAVVYNGDETGTDNTLFYWTKVTDVSDTATAAHLLGIATLTEDPVVLAGDTMEWALGHETNGTANKNFVGAIDMVRISTVARASNEFIFIPEPSTLVLACFSLSGIALAVRRRRKAW